MYGSRRPIKRASLETWATTCATLGQIGELFESFTLLWQEARTCSDTIEFSKAIVWKDLIPEGFEDTASELMSKVSK